MNENKIFSQFYSTETSRYEDKKKFRDRLLKYLEDEVNQGWPYHTWRLCRVKMGIDIDKKLLGNSPQSYRYLVEKTFINNAVIELLDFITVVHDSWIQQSIKEPMSVVFVKNRIDAYIENINQIFQEEAMCYVLHENGRVRYYPDEEFYLLTKSTINVLNDPKHVEKKNIFNDILEDFYRNYGKESPIQKFYSFVESMILSIVNDGSNVLNDKSIKILLGRLKLKVSFTYNSNDLEALSCLQDIILKWAKMCHKYRHGKVNHANDNVPSEQFNYIFSVGISIYRFLLELDK